MITVQNSFDEAWTIEYASITRYTEHANVNISDETYPFFYALGDQSATGFEFCGCHSNIFKAFKPIITFTEFFFNP